MNDQLTVQQPATAELYRQSTDVAGVCREIVVRTAMTIQGRKYVRVEGWQSIATAHGCCASARDVEMVGGGFRAIGEIRNIQTGHVIATAEGFVGEDEPTWFGGVTAGGKTLPKRPDYAIRAMCQTRAISRACRTAFAHVVVLMDAGLSTTPAEEVPEGGFEDARQVQEPSAPAPAAKTAPRAAESPKKGGWRDVAIHFGKNKGILLGSLSVKSLQWYAENCYPAKAYKGSVEPDAQRLADALQDAAGDLDILLGPPKPVAVTAGEQMDGDPNPPF